MNLPASGKGHDASDDSSTAQGDIVREWGSPTGLDECQELIEDLAAAQQALAEYEAAGVEGAIPYSEYRAKRLGTKS